MKTTLFAILAALLAPAALLPATVASAPKRIIRVDCPDLKCCPPLEEGDVCVYVGEVTCLDSKGNPTPC